MKTVSSSPAPATKEAASARRKGWTHYFGVSSDPSTNRVVEINLHGESEDPIFTESDRTSGYMTGTISHAICQLDQLTTIVIANWKGLNKQIPDCISSLSFLRILDLVGNNLTGTIPP
ncbi:DNA damage-repair/toleration protein DRT100 [Linum grandiflorum]